MLKSILGSLSTKKVLAETVDMIADINICNNCKGFISISSKCGDRLCVLKCFESMIPTDSKDESLKHVPEKCPYMLEQTMSNSSNG